MQILKIFKKKKSQELTREENSFDEIDGEN